MVKERDFGIDVLKMLAVITIVWSHLDNVLPGSLSKLATGGSFGDGFFFFCSGFTILMGGQRTFQTITRNVFIEYFHQLLFGVCSVCCCSEQKIEYKTL
jgi:peptidoglycan/LPS O-acetylase OafA/YrhL